MPHFFFIFCRKYGLFLCLGGVFAFCLVEVSIAGGEILYNGIQLPNDWPPKQGDPNSMTVMDVPYLREKPKIVPIDLGRQLLIDDFLIESTDLKRTFHQPTNYSGNPVLKPETPLELQRTPHGGKMEAACYLINGGVFYDPKDGLFKMWYNAGWRGPLAHATSRDALHWERAKLSATGNNLETGIDDNCVWLDLETENSAERVKLLRNVTANGRDDHHEFLVSPNGLAFDAPPVTAGKASDYCSFFYNPFRKMWVYSIKRMSNNEGTRARVRYYAESPLFLKDHGFDGSVFWANADSLDKPDPTWGEQPQLYNLNAVAYESLMIGMFSIFLGPPNEIAAKEKIPKTINLSIAFSRDGFHWDRPERKFFLSGSGQEGDWNRGYLHSAGGLCLVVRDKLYFPYTAYSGISPTGFKGLYTGGSIGIAMLRRDGFASMNAERAGTLTTRPVIFTGKYFFVNVDSSKGELKVEALDENGNVIEPFSIANCMPVTTDETLQAVSWKGASDLSALTGKPVKFRFHLKSGSLYAFWVSPNESGASYGYVAAGGPGYTGNRDTVGRKALVAAP